MWSVAGDGFDGLEDGLRSSYAARAVTRLADLGPHPDAEDLHELRKRVKDHWYHVRLLRAAWPPVMTAWADEAHVLAEQLGDDHDLSVLAAVLTGEGPDLLGAGPRRRARDHRGPPGRAAHRHPRRRRPDLRREARRPSPAASPAGGPTPRRLTQPAEAEMAAVGSAMRSPARTKFREGWASAGRMTVAGGRRRATTTAATRAVTAPTRRPTAMASTKESRAASATAAPCAPAELLGDPEGLAHRRGATASPTAAGQAVDECRRRRCGSGWPARCRARRCPAAPPTSRAVSFTAEPMPARLSGTALMIIAVVGAMARPEPVPMSSRASTISGVAAVSGSRTTAAGSRWRGAAGRRRPRRACRTASAIRGAPRRDQTSIARALGIMGGAGEQGAVAPHVLEVLGERRRTSRTSRRRPA